MVEAVTAYKASDGSVHATKAAAVRADARLELVALGLFNEGTIKALLDNPHPVIDALRGFTEIQETSNAQHA